MTPSSSTRHHRKPNFLVLLVDEQRYPPVYENPEIAEWRKRHLVTQQFLRSNGVEFHRHYIGSSACCPSRATLLTGHYPSLHGVSQTNGVAKESYDPDMFWLGSSTVPTMGNYFRAAGYETYYKGKWHLSDEDIIVPGTHNSVPSYNELTGWPDDRQRLYACADRLENFGFSGWIGPEPHGKNPRNSASSAAYGASGRDEFYAEEAASLIEALDRRRKRHGEAAPWLLVASFVNPHDIVLYGDLTAFMPVFRFEVDPDMPEVAPPPTMRESLATKPRCQASYRDVYPEALQPITDQPFYRKLYYQLQKKADRQMGKVLEALARSSFYDDTIVIFTSDHGDLLGSHGRLYQKWYCAYEEMLHVPFVIYNRRLFPEQTSVDALTSHLDVLPTMLGLANAETELIRDRLQSRFSEARPFVGRNLAPTLTAAAAGGPAIAEEPIYFMTDDDVTRGPNQMSPLGKPYASVVQPNHIETVLLNVQQNPGQPKQLWKLSRYFDNVRFWSEPGVRDVTFYPSGNGQPGAAPGWVPFVKTKPLPDEYELYNVTSDPLETRNLAYSPAPELSAIRQRMMLLLEEQRRRKRLYPSEQPC